MVVIRLARGGSKKRPFYQVVVADKRASRDGRFIEKIGFFNPMARGQEVETRFDLEVHNAGMAKGAQPTERVSSLGKALNKAA